MSSRSEGPAAPDDVDALVAEVVAELRAQEARETAAIAAFETATNRHVVEQINAALAAGTPARVRVVGVRASYDFRTGHDQPWPVCDFGRTGRVLHPVDVDRERGWVHVEQLSPGDDGCPVRYHQAGDLALLAPGAPEAPPQTMRVEAIAFWSGADELAVADTADTVITEMGHAAAVQPDDHYGTVFLMREHDRPNYRLRPPAVAAVLSRLAGDATTCAPGPQP